jgi:hypothetical protein
VPGEIARHCAAFTAQLLRRAKDVLDLLAAGATREEILSDYPYLEAEDIGAVLEFAAKQNERPARFRVLSGTPLPACQTSLPPQPIR